jgi:hypothetical protein
MKQREEALFLLIIIAFSAMLVLLSLLSCVRLTALNDRAAALSRELETARAENAALSVAYEQSVSLPELARRAAALGMQPCTPSQIVTLPMPEE